MKCMIKDEKLSAFEEPEYSESVVSEYNPNLPNVVCSDEFLKILRRNGR